MTIQNTAVALAGLYLITGIVVLLDLGITPRSVRRHYQNLARTDPETAMLMREYPLLCAASHGLAYLLVLAWWPLTMRAMARRSGGQQ